MAAIAAETSW